MVLSPRHASLRRGEVIRVDDFVQTMFGVEVTAYNLAQARRQRSRSAMRGGWGVCTRALVV